MIDEEIKEIADKLIENSNESIAFFGIVEKNQNYFIKANKDGLRLYSAEMLYASITDNESKTWGISNEWYDSSSLEINHIELIDEERNRITKISSRSKGLQYFEKLGCGVAVIVLAIFFVVGAIMTIKAIIKWF